MHDCLPPVCFIVCDSGPATHFAEFAKHLCVESNLHIIIYATGLALTKLQDIYLPEGICLCQFTLDDLNHDEEQELARKLIDSCLMEGTQTIIIDIANKFDIKLQEACNKLDLASFHIRVWCYYDNPEDYVPGGYSIRSREMIKLTQNILFANINLVKRDRTIFSLPNTMINLNGKTIQGIGYYPIEIADHLQKQRQIERETLRAKYNWDNTKYVFVYFGGNNTTYYDQAFPAFLSFLSQIDCKILEHIIFLIHQHPAAKKQNDDGLLFLHWLSKNNHIHATLSLLTTDEAQIIADGIFYYQTSMAPQFALLGLPTMQVGHEVYPDVLVKYNLCHITTNTTELAKGLAAMKERNGSLEDMEERKQLIYNAIGYSSDWSENLRNLIFEF